MSAKQGCYATGELAFITLCYLQAYLGIGIDAMVALDEIGAIRKDWVDGLNIKLGEIE